MTVISSLKEGSRNKSNSYGVKRRQINLRSMSEPNMSKNGAAHLASGSSNPQKGPLLIQHQTSLPDPQKLADVPIIFVLGKSTYRNKKWAKNHICCLVSTIKYAFKLSPTLYM